MFGYFLDVASGGKDVRVKNVLADRACLDRLLVHLKPMHRSKQVVCWSDKNIRAGDKWRAEIKKSIEEADIAILLVSADFLASDFIVNNELPPLLASAEGRGQPLQIMPTGFNPRHRVRSRASRMLTAAEGIDGCFALVRSDDYLKSDSTREQASNGGTLDSCGKATWNVRVRKTWRVRKA